MTQNARFAIISAILAVPLAVASVASAAGGTTWTLRAAPNAYWAGVAYGNGIYAAVSANSVMTSPDGVTWSSQAVAGGWTGVTFDGSQFVAVGSSGAARAMTSPDGLTWTPQPGLSTAQYDAVTQGDDTYVAVGQQWVAYSTDAVTWTEINVDPVTANQWRSIAYGNGTFVAINSNTGTSVPVMTSPDGVTWTQRTAGIAVEGWTGITYGGGQFVAVGLSGANRVMTSPDGVTWTDQVAPGAEVWRSIAYAGGQYVAVGHSGAVMTSPDAVTWTAQTSGNSGVWRAIVGGPQYVAVGQSSGLPVMTSFISAAPTVASVDPPTGSTAGGSLLTIDGTGLLTGVAVEVGGSACSGVTVVSPTRVTCVAPASPAGAVNVTVTNSDGQSDTAAGAFTFVAPPPPPPPVYPPSAPRDVAGVAGDGSVVVSWSVPASSGSFAVSNYQVTASPSGRSCVVSALSCEISGLTNGSAYEFTVRALNGAGWGPWSVASGPVVPVAPVVESIVISGVRGEVRGKPGVIVTGTSSLDLGAVVVPWVRFPGQSLFAQGSAQVAVDEAGGFTWERRTGKKITIYMATPDGSLMSNRIIVRP